MMTQTSHAPETFVQTALGWSDLEEDEALLLWLLRHWQHGRQDRPATENEFSQHLAADRYALTLASLFSLFARLDSWIVAAPPQWPLLSADEITLLDALGGQTTTADDMLPVVVMTVRAAFADAGIRIRPGRQIAASDQDRLALRIDRAGPYATG